MSANKAVLTAMRRISSIVCAVLSISTEVIAHEPCNLLIDGLGNGIDGNFRWSGTEANMTDPSKGVMTMIYQSFSDENVFMRMNYDVGKYEINGAATQAQCDGCKFPSDPNDGQGVGTWEVKMGDTWNDKPHAMMRCCPGQTWPCDSCGEDQCRKHTNFLSCEAAKILKPCCFYDLSAGVCSCDREKTTQCTSPTVSLLV